ncbi:Rpn family recombination-promoting nuclease/putative transposase [Sporosarcina sp. NCCP-2378]|uniref:Rpn family recombination-promoting nuclease/putative transposase n=1 Tax=Sporosarcina sp. NCCP-2378 TaxID=2934651 RepID=UPI00223127B7|nr:Rpn family recombination-promoting nuclease/putative transposase [Sporosarcina sp. NCCP-2378]
MDYAFKQLFGSEQNKEITVVFLNAILQRSGRHAIKEIAFASQEVGGEYQDDKQSRLDILVKTQEEELINVEIQLTNQYDMVKRTLFYWSRIYNSSLQKGMGYNTLLPAITINICNFDVFNQTDSFHNTFHLYEKDEKFRMDDVLEIHFIEMTKFIKLWHQKTLDPWNNLLARWLLLLGMVDARKKKVYNEIYKELEELAMRDEQLQEAFTVWQDLSQSPEEFLAYQSRLKYILDEEAKFDDVKHMAEKKGLEEGRQKGLEQGLERGLEQGLERGLEQGKLLEKEETVKRLFKLSLTVEQIAEATSLDTHAVERIIGELS